MVGRLLGRGVPAAVAAGLSIWAVKALRGAPAPVFDRPSKLVAIPRVVAGGETSGSARGWAEPEGGECPLDYPVKGNRRSGIYHQPGGLAYARTHADRCYATPADAEADELRPAKR